MKILITGGEGTIGYFLAERLRQQGQKVDILDIKNGNDINDSKTFNKLDRDYDYVYHLAAINGTKNFYERPVDVLKVGVQGVINVLEWFKDNKKGKILFTSSNEAYASWINQTGGPIPTDETVPLCIEDVFNPRWSYGASKLIGEVLFANYSRVYGFPMSIVRYHNSYGPRMGMAHVIPEFIMRIIKKEKSFSINGGDETRSFCYIDDTVRATQMVMESDKTNGEIIHIGNNKEEIKIMDLAKKMFRLFKYRPKKIAIMSAPEGCVERRCPDLTKIKTLIGYQPEISLEEGLMRTYKYYEQESKAFPKNS